MHRLFALLERIVELLEGAAKPARWPAALSVAQATEYLGYESPRVVENLLRAGAFRAVQITDNGDRRILRSDIDAWLESRKDIPIKPPLHVVQGHRAKR